MAKKYRWPEGAIVYQIYPRSFYDSNGDGIGDLPGITSKLDHLKELGVNAVWLSPFYPSPMADFGYDVADYCDVDPIFGTLDDFKKMLKKAHKFGIRIMVDLVPNHSSDEHEWFRQSRQSREGKYADWYVWRDPKGFDKSGEPLPPNNWLGIFDGETAWEWEPARQQFYLHSFHIRQPDLNWQNPEVREAFKDVMRFWLDMGADGFRVDAVRFMGKDPQFKDNPKNPDYEPGYSKYSALIHKNSQGWPQLYDYLAEMAAVLKEKPYQKSPRFMVTEAYPDHHDTVKEYMAYYQKIDPEVSAPFNFEGLSIDWQAEPWKKFLTKFHHALSAFNPLCVPSYAFGNHDQHRLATRLGDEAARGAAVLLLTLPGMSFIYNGEEIGMKNGKIPPELVQDPGADDQGGRDPERTPLQWSTAKNAGFTAAEAPWLPVNEDYQTVNIESERRDPASFYRLYRDLCKLRNKSKALRLGDFKVINTDNSSALGFTRIFKGKGHVTLINFSEQAVTAKLPADVKIGRFQISSDAETRHKKVKNNVVRLLPYEAAVFAAKS